jgi:hypothetical protein
MPAPVQVTAPDPPGAAIIKAKSEAVPGVGALCGKAVWESSASSSAAKKSFIKYSLSYTPKVCLSAVHRISPTQAAVPDCPCTYPLDVPLRLCVYAYGVTWRPRLPEQVQSAVVLFAA